jgi:hypothetical protein
MIILQSGRTLTDCCQAGTRIQEEGWLGELLQSMGRRSTALHIQHPGSET